MAELSFGTWAFDPETGTLHNRRSDTEVHLRPQTALVLRTLISRAPDLVSRDELRALLWPDGVIVDFDTGINACIKQLRSVLGESAAHPVHIHTVPKKGFRFERGEDIVSGHRSMRRKLIVALLIMGLFVAGIWLMYEPPTDDRLTVAVMPFDDLPQTSESKHLQKVLLADLTVRLGGADPQRIAVIARRTVLTAELGGLSSHAVGEALGADFLLEGTIRSVVEGHIVSMSLIGPNDRFLWGELFEISAANPEPDLKLIRQTAIDEVLASATIALAADHR